MSWLDRVSLEPQLETDTAGAHQQTETEEAHMQPGLTGQYDEELREKAAMHMPPPPPEYMGPDGAYDPNGLAKRVAQKLDEDPIACQLETVHLHQSGNVIQFEGEIDNQPHLQHLIDLAAQVDGTAAVDASRVEVHA